MCMCTCRTRFCARGQGHLSFGRLAGSPSARAGLSPRSPELGGYGGKGLSLYDRILKNPRGSLVPVAGKGTRLQEKKRLSMCKARIQPHIHPCLFFFLVLER